LNFLMANTDIFGLLRIVPYTQILFYVLSCETLREEGQIEKTIHVGNPLYGGSNAHNLNFLMANTDIFALLRIGPYTQVFFYVLS
jgi:hypothetical protein